MLVLPKRDKDRTAVGRRPGRTGTGRRSREQRARPQSRTPVQQRKETRSAWLFLNGMIDGCVLCVREKIWFLVCGRAST